MVRPRKDDLSKRNRWEIYVTPLERHRIEEAARATDLPIGAAAAKAPGGVQHVECTDRREIVRLLTAADRRMGGILVALRDRTDRLDVLDVAAALVSLDRAVRAQAMPWTLRENEADESAAGAGGSWPGQRGRAMMIVWWPHRRTPAPSRARSPSATASARSPTTMASPVMRKDVGGRVVEVVRDPSPEMLGGDEQFLRLTLLQQTSVRRYSGFTLPLALEDVGVAGFNAGEPQARRLIDLALTVVREAAFVGIPSDARPHVFATAHTIHAGRVEVNVASNE